MSDVASNDLPAEPHPDPAPAAQMTLGAQLAAARMAHEWSVEQVASQLNLAPRQIQALEADNYSALPGMASVRGFVRAYAKLLKIDADSLVALIPSEQSAPTTQIEPKRSVSAAPFSDTRSLSSGRRRSSAKTALFAAIVLLLAVGVINVEHMGGWPVVSQSLTGKLKGIDSSPLGSNASASASASAETPMPVKTDSVAESLPSPQTSGGAAPVATTDASAANASAKAPEIKKEEPKPDAKTSVAVEKTVQQEVKPVAPEVKPAVPASNAGTTKPVAADAKSALVFNVRKDSWIEVRDAQHAVLLSRMVKAGSTEQLEVTQPVSLVVGNAAGVDIVFRGVPVETKTDAKSNVARLNLK